MDKNTILAIAEKIKNKTATEEEINALAEEMNILFKDVKDILGNE